MSDHYCTEHKAVFFKKGNMKGYAHPIEGTDPTKWCNEPEEGGAPIPEEKKAELVAETSGKNRSYALSYSKDWCVAQLGAGKNVTTYDMLIIAKLLESYLDSGIIEEKKAH